MNQSNYYGFTASQPRRPRYKPNSYARAHARTRVCVPACLVFGKL